MSSTPGRSTAAPVGSATGSAAATGFRCTTPTEWQMELLRRLPFPELFRVACKSMHALNRKAKHVRGYPWGEESDSDVTETRIYAEKDAFLSAVVAAGWHDALETFVGYYRITCRCDDCNREWTDRSNERTGGSYCYECSKPGRVLAVHEDRWYLVTAGGFRFHRPACSSTKRWLAVATPIDAHDPWQPSREVPDIGLTIPQMFAAVRLCAERIRKGEPKYEIRAGAMYLTCRQ